MDQIAELNNESVLSGVQRRNLEGELRYFTVVDTEEPNNNENAQNNQEKYCWVCFATESENRSATWVHPCNCRGSTKWVHRACLNRWIDEKQNGNALRTVHCQQCRAEYLILFPRMGVLANIIELYDVLVERSYPMFTTGIGFAILYCTCVTFGSVTILQIFGQDRGLEILEESDALLTLVGLPAIPISLVLLRMIPWEDAVVRLLENRRYIISQIPILNLFFSNNNQNGNHNGGISTLPFTDSRSGARLIFGAICLPTLALTTGRLLYSSVQNMFYRTFFGGLTYLGIKGVLKIYLKMQQIRRRKSRVILNYIDPNARPHQNAYEADDEALESEGDDPIP